MVFLLNGVFQDVIDIYFKVFEMVKVCGDFVEILVGCFGKYFQMIGVEVDGVLKSVMEVFDSVKEFVVGWLQECYGVLLK